MADSAKKIENSSASFQSNDDVVDVADLVNLIAKRADLIEEVTSLEGRVRDLALDVELSQKNFESARAEIEDEVRRAQVSLRADDAEGALKRARIELEVANLNAQQAAAQRGLETARLQLDRTQDKSNDSKKQYDAAQLRLKELLSILDTVQQQIQKVESELGASQRQVSNQTEAVLALENSIVGLQNQILRLNAEVESANLNIVQKQEKLAQTEGAISAAESRRFDLNSELVLANNEIAKANDALKELEVGLQTRVVEHEAKLLRLLSDAKALEDAAEKTRGDQLRELTEARRSQLEVLEKEHSEHQLKLQREHDEAIASAHQFAANQAEEVLAAAKLQAAELLKQAEIDSERVGKHSDELLGRAEKSAEDVRMQAEDVLNRAEKSAEETRKQATADYQAAIKDAIESKSAAEFLRAKAQAEYDSIIAEAQGKVAVILEDATVRAAEGLKVAEIEAAAIKNSVQADYDAKMAEGHKQIEFKRSNMESSANAMVKDSQRKAKEVLGKARAEADGINGEVDRIKHKAMLDAQGVLEKAKADTDSMKAKTDSYLQSLQRKADEEYDLKRREMDAKIDSYKASKVAGVTKWEQEQIESVRASRKRHIEEASRTVVQLVQKQLAGSAKTSLKPDEANSLLEEIDKSVRGILSNDNAAAKEKLKKLMADPVVKTRFVGIKLSKDSYVAIGVGAAVIAVIGAILLFFHYSRSGGSSENYVSRVGEERRAGKVYSPTMSNDYKGSYTDNVMFTNGYVKTELETKFQDQWIVSLNRFVVHKLDMNDRIVVTLVPLETALLRRLDKMRSQVSPATEKSYIAKMRDAEEETVNKLERVLGGPKNLQLFFKHKRAFYEENAPK